MPKFKDDLTAGFVRSILDYDPDTGIFRWKYNPNHAQCWNTRRAGQIAGGRGSRFGAVAIIRIDGPSYVAHRLAWLITHGEWPAGEIDHINGDPLDNRLTNLRIVTHSQNSFNKAKQSNNTTGYVGVVHRYKRGDLWEARISRDGKIVWQAYFTNPQEAAAARRKAVEAIHEGLTPENPNRLTKYRKKVDHSATP